MKKFYCCRNYKIVRVKGRVPKFKYNRDLEFSNREKCMK